MKDISRNQAQKRATHWFGPKAFCRKKAKTKPGARKQLGLMTGAHNKVRVIGAGSTWAEAFASSVVTLRKLKGDGMDTSFLSSEVIQMLTTESKADPEATETEITSSV